MQLNAMLLIRIFLMADWIAKEYTMSRKQFSLGKKLTLASALAFGASGLALADDSSMSPFTGESWVYFNGAQKVGRVYQAEATRSDAPAAARRLTKNQSQTEPKNVRPNVNVTASPPSPFTDKGT